ncbi:MAG: Hsp20/alpha crystallin family protein [Candidatus Micrarchaeota archaeon]|nr:Hsp20/alpha crystallin family protein [Candidatus Micrarchaeota archaeon]
MVGLVRWKPFQELDLERFFDEDFPFFATRPGLADLATDVYDDGNNIVVKMNAPGFQGDGIEITFEGNYLKVSGQRKEEKEEKQKNYYCKEIRAGSFERMIRLPTAVKADKAEAEYKDGVLKITVPKEEPKGTKVKVKVKN